MQQNLALDRFRVWRVGYLQSQVEIDALCHALPDLPRNIAENMAKVVNSVREQYQGKGGNCLSMTISTRMSHRWTTARR
jgi:cobaltochelatase CobS